MHNGRRHTKDSSWNHNARAHQQGSSDLDTGNPAYGRERAREGSYGNYSSGQYSGSQSPTRSSGSEQNYGTYGKHYGKGPKGYKRSDDRIKEDVCEALMRDHDVDASEIDVLVENGIVTLRGTVDERRAKRLAEDCVDKVDGIKDIHNELRLQSSGHSSTEGMDSRAAFSDQTSKSGSGTEQSRKAAKTTSENKIM